MGAYFWQILSGAWLTLSLALCALLAGLPIGLAGAALESIQIAWLRWLSAGIIFLVRGLPELLVLFFIYFGLTGMLSSIFHRYIDVSPFAAGVAALALIFGAYASQVFRGAFQAVNRGQIDAACAIGMSSTQIFFRIQSPQAWRHALPGLGNLCMVLLKDTALVSLIGLSEIMNQAKLAASSTHQPFTCYLGAALIYLAIVSVSEWIINGLNSRANRMVQS